MSGPVTPNATSDPNPDPSASAPKMNRASAGERNIVAADAPTTAAAIATAVRATTRMVHRSEGSRRWIRINHQQIRPATRAAAPARV